MKIFMQKYDKTIRGVSTTARKRLLSYDWPGNVRQLRNVVESMVVVDFDGFLDVDDLPDEIIDSTPTDFSESSHSLAAEEGPALLSDEIESIQRSAGASNGVIVPPSPNIEKSLKPFVGLSLDTLERLFIQETLRATGGNREETAKLLGVGERTLYRRLKQFSQENEQGVKHDK